MLGIKIKALERGAEGESLAARHLERNGLRVVDRHYQTRWGEIDLVCRDRDTWVFVEVKTRIRKSTLSAVEALTLSKQKKIIGAALSYMKKLRLVDQSMRFDVVTIEGDCLEWITDAFEAPATFTF